MTTRRCDESSTSANRWLISRCVVVRWIWTPQRKHLTGICMFSPPYCVQGTCRSKEIKVQRDLLLFRQFMNVRCDYSANITSHDMPAGSGGTHPSGARGSGEASLWRAACRGNVLQAAAAGVQVVVQKAFNSRFSTSLVFSTRSSFKKTCQRFPSSMVFYTSIGKSNLMWKFFRLCALSLKCTHTSSDNFAHGRT